MATQNRNDELLDDLASIVDGDPAALARHADHLADDDDARDLKHDAARIAEQLADAGADYEPPSDLEARVLAKLDAGVLEASAKPFALPEGAKRAAGIEDRDESPSVEAPPAIEARNESASREEPKPASEKTTAKATPKVEQQPKRRLWLVGALAVAAVIALAIIGKNQLATPSTDSQLADGVQPGGGLTGTVSRIVRAANDNESGLSLQLPGATAFVAATAGTQVPIGATVRTDDRTRVRLDLSDGSTIVVNHGSEVTLSAATPRAVVLRRGELVAEVAHLEQGPHATFETPTGNVEVLGTKFVLTATDTISSVRVARGAVRAHAKGQSLEVKAGEEGLMPRDAAASVTPAPEIARGVQWSELETEPEVGEQGIQGLGELRARRPGERQDRERPLTLSDHKVQVRIVEGVARTEIEETFRNDSGETLEGIYRFPLPPDARIASLSLEVDGRWEQGAFVEKDRAARIWRGVIRNATAVAQRQPEEEFIWVPGPWRDPALLEWQRGGRFELRIFPIPAHGERKIRLAYTQSIAATGKERSYVYPLPFSGDASTRVGNFSAEVRVAGARTVAHAVGYTMQSAPEQNGVTLRMNQTSFLPAGDLRVDYELEHGDAELRTWTFAGQATVPPPANSREGDEEVDSAQRQLHEDPRGYVAFALRPELPAWASNRARDYVIVVDASQSMVGERYDRAVRLATHLVSEMDRRDRVVVLACDSACQRIEGDPMTPSSATANTVRDWLAAISPAGASDLGATMRAAAAAAPDKDDETRETRVLYIGDGVASTGHRRAASLSSEVDHLASERLSFTTVSIGADSDTTVMQAIARAGGGHHIEYRPGERASTTALAILETTYGASLSEGQIEVPEGVVEVYPTTLPTLRAGEEVIVVGRLASTAPIRGEVHLRGKVGGRDFEQRYPVTITPSTGAGNAFVPQLWASKTIERLELEGRGENRPRIVALSKSFGVMSRHTSLLVLESEAMFRAFGVDRAQPTVQWTGDGDVETSESEGMIEQGDGMDLGSVGTGGFGGLGMRGAGSGAGAGGGRAAHAASMDDLSGANAAPEMASRRDSRARSRNEEAGEAPATEDRAPAINQAIDAQRMMQARPAEPAGVAPQPTAATSTAPVQQQFVPPPMARPGRWVRRVWVRTGEVQTTTSVTSGERRAVDTAQAALRANPDSRDRHRDLVRALSRAGELGPAKETVRAWMLRDPNDPEALTFLADIAAREGERDESLRVLSGVVDLAPGDASLHERLAKAFERGGDAARACSHRIALAEIQSGDAAKVAAAVRCERALGREEGARWLLDATSDATLRTRIETAASETVDPERARGELMLNATWSGGTDLDVALITPQGSRLSSAGGRTTVSATDSTALGRESVGLRRASVGTYVIEVTRTKADDATPAMGRIEVEILGSRRVLEFTMNGPRVTVGRVAVTRTAQTMGF